MGPPEAKNDLKHSARDADHAKGRRGAPWHRKAHTANSKECRKEHAMEADRVTAAQAARAAPVPTTPTRRMRAAVDQAVAVGPSFLRGDIDADHMANTMVRAVRTYAEHEPVAAGDGVARGAEAQALHEALAELMACGAGYLAGRCDAACVARTMTQMVHEFGPR
ncbi:MAG: hypothetical protein ABIN44_09695 [Burkholderiaceae bacterium]